MKQTIIPAGYRLTITSWENDADNYQTTVHEGLTKAKVEFILELCCKFTSGSNNGGTTFGNMYEPDNGEMAKAAAAIREVMLKHEAVLDENDRDFLFNMAPEDAMWSAREIMGEYLDTSENYAFRVYDGAKVEYVPHEIRMEDVTLQFNYTNWAAAIGKAVQDAVLAARAPADSVLEDAARYRWIRESERADSLIQSDCRGVFLPQRHALDAAIDTALFTTPAQRGEVAGDGNPCNNDHDPDCRWPDCLCRHREAQFHAARKQGENHDNT